MKKIVFVMFILLLAFSAGAAEVKLAYVDMQKVVTESDQGKEAVKTLNSLEKAKKSLVQEKVKEIKKLEEELAKQGAILNPEIKQKKEGELEKMMAEYQKMRRDSEEELQKNEAEFIQKIILDVQKLLAKIAADEGYSAILNKQAVLYLPDEFDLTDRVIKQFNEMSAKTKETN